MPKPRIQDYDRAHLRNLTTMCTRIDRIYRQAAKEAARIGASVRGFDAEQIFSFEDHPEIRAQVDRLLSELAATTETAIASGVRSAWTLSNNKNNEISRVVFGDNVGKLSPAQYRRYFTTNAPALEAFLARKEQGLNLSDRVWRYTTEFKSEIEMGLDLGIRTGLDAPALARSLQEYLQYPDKLFRRVRDEHGMLHLSKAAADFHPGTGVYRSSYKNARRLAATETNIAYRTADHLRWQDMDFVVGIEIKMSNNHTLLGADGKPHAYYDMCDRLAGRYPKDFKFTGWHPHCRCHAEPILKTQEEMDADTERILDGEEPTPSEESENAVSDVPQAFKDHIEKYADTIRTVDNSRLPYYVQDNRGRVDEVLGLAVDKGSISATPNPQKAAEYLAIEQALGITQGAPMSFEEANELRGNPHYAEAESYRINCQTCVVANELRRRGFPVEALPNTKGSALEKLSYATQNAWLDADGNIPKKIQCYTLNMDRRGRIVTKEANKWKLLDEATKEPGRYHVDWRWKRTRSGHIVTLERLDDGRIRWYDPQSGTINCMTRYWETKVTEIRVLRVDTLKPNPEVCKNVLAKSGSKSVLGKAAGGGKIGSERKVRTPMTEEQKARRKEIQKELISQFANTKLSIPDLGKEVTLSKTNIKELVNQPHEKYEAKNEALLHLQELLNSGKLLPVVGIDKHDPRLKVRLLEVKIEGIKSWIVLREQPNGIMSIHSISDTPSIIEKISK